MLSVIPSASTVTSPLPTPSPESALHDRPAETDDPIRDAHRVLLPQPRLQRRHTRLVGSLDAAGIHDGGGQRSRHVTRCLGERLRAGLHRGRRLGDRVRRSARTASRHDVKVH